MNSIDLNNIICGEKIQEISNIYLGLEEDYNFNPYISNQITKFCNISKINDYYNNPEIMFCYTHRIDILSSKLDFFLNEFILITHNSDYEITYDNIYVKNILNNKKIKKWFSQNITFHNNKLYFIPIGIANSQWEHGINTFKNTFNENIFKTKTKNVYFNFAIMTNFKKRQPCYDALKYKIEWLENINPSDNIKRLCEYKFCICPEGNGVDSHRIWEALYLKTVPIVIKSEFTNIIKNFNIPLVILDSWEHFNIEDLNYDDFNFNSSDFLDLLNFEKIKEKICKI